MKKTVHRKHIHAFAAVYQDESDFQKVLALVAAATILLLSLFAMEHFAGVPVSVRGEQIYNPLPTPSTRRSMISKPSLAAQRRAARFSHVAIPTNLRP